MFSIWSSEVLQANRTNVQKVFIRRTRYDSVPVTLQGATTAVRLECWKQREHKTSEKRGYHAGARRRKCNARESKANAGEE